MWSLSRRATRRCCAALVVAAAVATLAANGPAARQSDAQPTQSPPGGRAVSGSFGNRADAYLSFSITGGNLKLRPGTPASYEGTWGGGPITLSGEMAVSRAAGSVSYVTMSANLAGKSWHWPATGQEKVDGRTVSKQYRLTFVVPSNYQGSEVTGSARLDVCGGACGVYAIDFRMTVKKGATQPPATTTTTAKPTGLPQVHAFAPRMRGEPGRTVTLEYSVKDVSGRATAYLFIYQGGARVMRGSGQIAATGQRKTTTVTLPATLVGPLFFCVWAENAKGHRSKGSPKSSCAWIPFLTPVKNVSNGCGGEGWDTIVEIENYFGNVHTYADSNIDPDAEEYTVDFVDACDLHDAGYAGVMVDDAINGGPPVDYRTWRRLRVDNKFRQDMLKICNASIPATAKVARSKCRGKGGPLSIGALTLYNFVRKYGWHFFDADLTMDGVQTAPNYRTLPSGGARPNFP